jgi:hypothetical protein
MYTSFQNLSDQAQIWIYQADRQLTAAEADTVLRQAKLFLETWTSHGRPFTASAEIRHGYFLILGIEQADFELSCCTTDSAIQFLSNIQALMGINFLDRQKLLLQAGNQYISTSVREVKEQLKRGMLPSNAHIFNNTIIQKKDLATSWLVPIQQSWLAR